MAFSTTAGNPSTLQGTTSVDVLSSAPQVSDFIVYGDEANDIINVNSPVSSSITNVSVYGQDGADRIQSDTTKYISGRTQGGKGSDNLIFNEITTASLYGGADADTITVVLATDSTAQGSKGNDRIRGAVVGGNDTGARGSNAAFYGGEGDDLMVIGEQLSSTVQGSKGNDTINLLTGDYVLSKVNGGSENDSITVFSAVGEIFKGSTLNGNKGSDQIVVQNDVTIDEITIFGGSGNDNIAVGNNRTTVSGDKGNDIVEAGTANNTSVTGGDGDDIINLDPGTNATQSVNGNAGKDTIVLNKTDLGGVIIMQGREDSIAATQIAGNPAPGAAIADNTAVVFGNEVDVVTDYNILSDRLGLGLTTTGTNINFMGNTGAGNDNAIAYRDLTQVAQLEWEDTTSNGETTVLGGLWNEGTDTFTVGFAAADVDLMIIQGNGSEITANSSIIILDNVVSGNNNATTANFTGFGRGTNAASVAQFVGFTA